MYLLDCDTFGCVFFQAIVGVAENWSEIKELLYNYYGYMKSSSLTFENDNNNIRIYKISKEDYKYLCDLYYTYEEEIEEYLEKELRFKPENINTNFWFAPLYIDADKYMIFDKPVYKKYKEILSRSRLAIE